jgi:hypothetical protein
MPLVYKMQRLEVSGAVRHIRVIRRLKVKIQTTAIINDNKESIQTPKIGRKKRYSVTDEHILVQPIKQSMIGTAV